MDETQPETTTPLNSVNFTISDENDEETAKLAPVSIKAGLQLTKVFSKLSENWKKFAEIEGGEAIAAIIKDLTVEEQLERMESMPMAELLNVIRFHLRKMTTLKDENDQLSQQNRELSAQLHRVEHRVGKAQVEVFEKMEGTIRQIVDQFHNRELDLAQKLERFEEENRELKAKNRDLEARVVVFEEKVEKLTKECREKTAKVEEQEQVFGKLAKKFDETSEENVELKEKLEQARRRIKDVEEEALHEAAEAQNLRVLIVKTEEDVWEKARRHEQALKNEMDQYTAKVEQQMHNLRNKCKTDMEEQTREHRTTVFQKDSQIQKLTVELEKRAAEVAKFQKHFAMVEAQIKGNVKRKLAVNYQEMLNIVSQGPSHIIPPYSNPLLDLARDLETEEKENSMRRRNVPSNSCPSSPRRNVGVQASRPEKSNPAPARRLGTGAPARFPHRK